MTSDVMQMEEVQSYPVRGGGFSFAPPRLRYGTAFKKRALHTDAALIAKKYEDLLRVVDLPPADSIASRPFSTSGRRPMSRHELTELLRQNNITALDLIRVSPTATIKKISAFIAALMLLSLLTSAVFGVHIVNPIYGFLTMVSFIGFVAVAKVHERGRGTRR